MGRPTQTPPSDWIEEGLRALAAGGPEAVRVEALARALGVTKGGFYKHFDHRPALLDEMLDTWERLVIDQVIEQVGEGGDARGRLRALFALGESPARSLLRVEFAIRDWGRRDRAVARRVRRIDKRRLDYLRAQFREFCADEDEVELRAMTALAMFIGVPSISADLLGRRRAELQEAAYERLLA